METVAKHPHEARVQRWGYATLLAAGALAALVALRSSGVLFGWEAPFALRIGAVGAGVVVGLVAVARRSILLALVSAALIVLGVLAAGEPDPGLLGYAGGILLGGLLLGYSELVHQTARYDRAHKLVEEEGASEASLDRVTDEALKTLGSRTLTALGIAAVGVAVALLLSATGPAAFKEGTDTASPVGVAVLSLAVFAVLSLIILARGARLRPAPTQETQEVAADVRE